MAALALTDHDDVRGYAEMAESGAEQGVDVISGVEISSWRHGVDIHILAYGFDPLDSGLTRMLESSRATRKDRAVRMVRKLAELGAPIEMEAVLSIAGDASIGRPHVARALVDAGHVGTIREAFDRWLGDGKPACVEKLRVSPAEAIALIHAAGGVAVCAHPATVGGPGSRELDLLVDEGIDGVEVRHSVHGVAVEAQLERFARERGLLRSGGTDYHGPRLSSNEIGSVAIPREWWDAVVERVNQRRAQAGKATRAPRGV
jgi:3',5'-nucleoside bisphosphate phosphatase